MSSKRHQAEDYLKKPPNSNDAKTKQFGVKQKRDEKDIEITKLK